MAGQNLAGVIAELGGKAPMIVFPDADLEQVSIPYSYCTTRCGPFMDEILHLAMDLHIAGGKWRCLCLLHCFWSNLHHGSAAVGSQLHSQGSN